MALQINVIFVEKVIILQGIVNVQKKKYLSMVKNHVIVRLLSSLSIEEKNARSLIYLEEEDDMDKLKCRM